MEVYKESEMKKSVESFDLAVSFLVERVANVLIKLPENVKNSAQEIRIKVQKCVEIICFNKTIFIKNDGNISNNCFTANGLSMNRDEMQSSFETLCEDSVYSFQNQISNGFITYKNGHRVGICGSAVTDGEKIISLKNITSFNIRIAKEFLDCSNSIFDVFDEGLRSFLIIGPPGSGKTSILRDFGRKISLTEKFGARMLKVVTIDERSEIADTSLGVAKFDVGRCDVLDGFPKKEGLIRAVRCLSPDVIICDEIGYEKDIESIIYCANCGVKIITSIHAYDLKDFLNKPISHKIIKSKIFDKYIFLGNSENPGTILKICDSSELFNENTRSD